MKREPATRFEDVGVWRKAHEFVLSVYRLSASFPSDERFGLTSQLRRVAVSVPGNFAEGFKKRGKADKVRFFNISQGSLEEARYYLALASDLGYVDTSNEIGLADEVGRMLNAYIQAVMNRSTTYRPRLLFLLLVPVLQLLPSTSYLLPPIP